MENEYENNNYLLATIIFIVVSFFIWLTKPYMDYQNVRLNNEPIEVVVEYRSMTGDSLCTKLYNVNNNQGISPNVPDDVPDPHDITALTEGSRITLVGYSYEWQAKNLVTGNIQKKPSGMMDVIVWNGAGDTSFKTQLKNPGPQQFNRKNYSDCH